MKSIQQSSRYILTAIAAGLILSLNGCSSSYYDASYNRPQSRTLPPLPEISRPAPPPRYSAPKRATVKPYSPEVRKYSANKSPDSVITQKEVASVTQGSIQSESHQIKSVDIDPYADIPDSRTRVLKKGSAPTKPSISNSGYSPAVTSLLVRARADLAIGRSEAAVSKLERGLRIESQNPELWFLLAKAHYAQADYQQAITMAKKSIRYSAKDDLIAQSWALIKKAGEKSGDMTVVKEAINYSKVNP